MLRVFVRVGLPLAALALGTWIGLGHPDASKVRTTVRGAGSRLVARAMPNAAVPEVDAPPPPVLAPLSPLVDGQLPDPVPWPRLNAAVNTSRAWLLAEGPLRVEENPRRLVTLTFDDGPSPETTPQILKTLDRFGIKASFFLIGRYLDGDEPRNVQSRELARKILAAGHMIGNHTHDHALLTNGSRTDALRQIDAGEMSIERATGKRPILFRPPYGGLDAFGEEVLRRRGAELVLWSVEAGDMTRDDPEGLAESIIGQLEYAGGGTVLLHDVRWVTVRALPKVLEYLKKRAWDPQRPERAGFEVVDLPLYLRETGARPQPFVDRAELEHARSKLHVVNSNKKATQARKRSVQVREPVDMPTLPAAAPPDV